jgi:hypothetical protein
VEDKCQGTTLVVPKGVNKNLGFSPCTAKKNSRPAVTFTLAWKLASLALGRLERLARVMRRMVMTGMVVMLAMVVLARCERLRRDHDHHDE